MKRPKSSNQREKGLYFNYMTQSDIYNNKITPSKSVSNIQNENTSTKIISNYSINETSLINEQINILNNIWDRLGIAFEYKNNFINYIKNANNPGRIDIILQEKNNLKKFEQNLIDLKKEVINRENNLELLKKYNSSLGNIFNKGEIINNILEEVIIIIKKLRKNAINIVILLLKLKNSIRKFLNEGKIDINLIKQKFYYDPNYLNKMKNDILFLKDSEISKYIEMNNYHLDLFLTNCAPNPNKVNNFKKITIPISDEHMKKIRELRKALLIDEPFNNLSNQKDYKNNFKNKSLYSSLQKTRIKDLSERNMKINHLTYELNINEPKNNDNLFIKNKNNHPLNYMNFNINRNNNKNNYIKLNSNLLLTQKRIKIEREEIKPLSTKDFIHNLNSLKTDCNHSDIIKNKTKPIIKQNIIKNINNKNNEEEIKSYKNSTTFDEQKSLEIKYKEMSERTRKYYDEEFKKMDTKRKIREKELNDRIEFLENEKKEKNEEKLIEIIKNLEKKLKNEENLRKKIENENDEIKKQNNAFREEKKRMIEEIKNNKNEINLLSKEKNEIINEKKRMENDYNLLKEEKNNLENKYNDLNKENILLKKKISELEKLEKEKKIINEKHNISPNNIIITDYKIDYYRGNLTNLIKIIKDKIPLSKVPDFLKRGLTLNESIYNEDFYFKGIFPKIVISTAGEDINNIKGLCSLYYESNENISENLILRINTIFVIEDWENQIIKIINFIKKNIKFKRLEIYILYDKIENKFVQNQEAKKLFQTQLGFKWLCVVRDEKHQQRYIRLYCDKENESEENLVLKQKNNFYLDSLSILTVNNEDNYNLLKGIIDKESNINNPNNNKYINPNPIYSLVYDNPLINKKYLVESKKDELKEMKEKLWRFVIAETGWNVKEEDKKKIKNVEFDIENSVYKKIEKFYNENNIECLCDLFQNNISINFENNYSILIDNIYYNKISSNKIKILEEKKTKSLFFMIPSNDNTVLFYISELNEKLKELIIDNNNNIYENFLEFQPGEIFEFSLSSSRENMTIPHELNSTPKAILIPTFSIYNHLFSYNFKEIEKDINMTEFDTNNNIKVTSIDEYLNVKFTPDENIENSFIIKPNQDNENQVIIKNSFIIGIFDNDIIKDKLPILQLLYVTKENFLSKKNYVP